VHFTPASNMGSDDYSSAAGGALRLKGAKIKKHKKKKEKSSLETALSTGDPTPSRRSRSATPGESRDSKALDRRKKSDDAPVKDRNSDGSVEDEEETPRVKTATELRFEEARRKKVR
jgi:protein FAM32A